MPRLLLPACLAAVALVAGCSVVGAAAPGGAADPASADTSGGARSGRLVTDQPTSGTTSPVSSSALRRVDTIELDAEAISLRSGDRLVDVGSMRRSGDVVADLTRLLGTPRKTTTAVGDGGHCLPASTSYTWGGALRVVQLAKRASVGNALDVRVLASSVRSRSGTSITLEGPDGVQVGQDIATRIAAAPAADEDSLGTAAQPAWQVVLEQGWDSEDPGDGTNGVSALTDGTTVTVIGSPMPVHAAQSC